MMDELAKRLSDLFSSSGETYRDLSRSTGIPRSALQRYFTGESAKIPLDRIEILARHYGVSAEYLVGWDTISDDELAQLNVRVIKSPARRQLIRVLDGAAEGDILGLVRMIAAYRNK